MDITYNQVDSILKTLPISYYIKKKVDVTLDANAETSYCDIMNDRIVISFKQLLQTAQSLTNNNVENDVRCMLYHETSHAFLTPTYLETSNIVNIFEDERIESLLRNYYANVNFREFVKRVNNYNKNETPKTPMQLFYNIVRYRIGPKQFTDRVHQIIMTYQILSKDKVYYYNHDIVDLYNDIRDFFLNNNYANNCQLSQMSAQDNTNNTDISAQTNTSTSITIVDKASIDMTHDATKDEDYNDNTNLEEINNNIEALTHVVNQFVSEEYEQDVNTILTSFKNITKQNSNAINAYSGVFNVRSVIRDDYKYFIQQNRVGHVKAYSKLHLNLFIDCSGSFWHNDTIVNKLLHALTKFEKQTSNFDFTLISCGIGQRIRDKLDRIQRSDGCNHLTKDIFAQFKSVQKSDAQNFNIVLFDGDAFSSIYDRNKIANEAHNFLAFNTSNTIIISDPENEKFIKTYCKSAKVIITHRYVAELYKNLLIALKTLTR